MSHQETKFYIWTVGFRDNGDPMISGPFVDEDDAADGTNHLSQVRFIRLATRDRTKALPQIREQLRHGKPPPKHADAPMDTTTKRSIMDRVMHKNKDKQDNLDDD